MWIGMNEWIWPAGLTIVDSIRSTDVLKTIRDAVLIFWRSISLGCECGSGEMRKDEQQHVARCEPGQQPLIPSVRPSPSPGILKRRMHCVSQTG